MRTWYGRGLRGLGATAARTWSEGQSALIMPDVDTAAATKYNAAAAAACGWKDKIAFTPWAPPFLRWTGDAPQTMAPDAGDIYTAAANYQWLNALSVDGKLGPATATHVRAAVGLGPMTCTVNGGGGGGGTPAPVPALPSAFPWTPILVVAGLGLAGVGIWLLRAKGRQ